MAGKNLKAYTATISAPRSVLDMLRSDTSRARVSQCTVWVLATSRTVAVRALSEQGILARGTDMRPAMGNHFDQIRDAGLVANPEQGTVIATTLDVWPDDAIVLVSYPSIRVIAHWRMDKSVKATWRSIEPV